METGEALIIGGVVLVGAIVVFQLSGNATLPPGASAGGPAATGGLSYGPHGVTRPGYTGPTGANPSSANVGALGASGGIALGTGNFPAAAAIGFTVLSNPKVQKGIGSSVKSAGGQALSTLTFGLL